MGYSAVRTARHKYIQFRELKGMDELYDLEADPYELTNLIAKPEAGDLAGSRCGRSCSGCSTRRSRAELPALPGGSSKELPYNPVSGL